MTAAHLPFSAVVGQDEAKLALLLAAVEPRLGGVLLRGDKGSAKTTLARGLAELLPEGAPFVELPLGASEDRVIGAIDVAALLDSRTHTFRPGLLAAAHGGVLYVDEVNLLPDHLVDTLLDVAVSGVNRVERDGFSETHQARFVLVGSMNPEEGELRPQLLDRFGIAVDVRAPDDPSVRAEIVRRQLEFETTGAVSRSDSVTAGDSVASAALASPAPPEASTAALRSALADARPVRCAEETVLAAARLAVAVGAQGLRADLSLCRAAGALAGWEGRPTAVPEDLRRVAPLVLGHRRRRDPFEAPGIASDEMSAALDEALEGADDGGDAGSPDRSDSSSRSGPDSSGSPSRSGTDGSRTDGSGTEGPADAGATDCGPTDPGTGEESADGPRPRGGLPSNGDLPDPEVDGRGMVLPRGGGPGANRSRSASRSGAGVAPGPSGRRVGNEPFTASGQRLDASATAIAYATRTASAEPASALPPATTHPGAFPSIAGGDLRAVVAAEPQATLLILAVDASGSMAGRKRLDAARAAVLSLLGDAYRRRDRIAMVIFRGETADVVLRPTGSVEVARSRLADLPSGGRTPLAAGLSEVTTLVRTAQRTGGPRPAVVLVTDGRATAGGDDPLKAANLAAADLATTGVPSLVIDAETGPTRLGLARTLAETLGADYVLLSELEHQAGGTALADTIRGRVLASTANREGP